MACCQPKINYNRQLTRLFTFFKLPDKLFKSANPSSFLEMSKQGLYCESDNETEVSLKCMFCKGDSKLKTGNFEFCHLSCHDEKKYKDNVPVEFTPLQAEQAFTELCRQRNTLSPLDFQNLLDEFHSRDHENDPSEIVLALQKSPFNSTDNTILCPNESDEAGSLRDLDHQETPDQNRTRDDNSSKSTDIHVPTVNTVSQQSFDHHLVGENYTNETSLELVITSNVSAVPVSVQDISLSQQQPTLQQRLSTFRDLDILWPNPESMAHSGFSYIGQGSVQCFSCGGVIDDWLPTDNPYTKHKGTKPLYQRLKQASVPSIFAWSRTPRDSEEARRQRATERAVRKSISDSPLTLIGKPGNDLCDIGSEMECSDHNTEHALNLNTVLPEAPPTIKLCENSAQTDPYPPFSIERFMHNNSKILNYTGCDTYKKFRLILNSLGPAAYELNYYYHAVKNVSIENQLFLTLVKLRMHWTNFVLADMFEISETTVSNIFITWINFMYHQWKEVNIWPSRDLVSFFQPTNFREKFPKTRVIIDGTECPVKKPKPPIAQQATFSTYKNRNTVKILVGATPGGLISYVSEAFGGSTSDRQIVERSSLMAHCDPLDSIMADKGFNVQDIFASFDVSINIPSFFKKKNRLDGTTVQRDRVISSKRVHVERLIGLAKTFKIMRDPLTIGETNLSTEIFFVCCMLTNFKEGIISKSA